MTYLPVRTPPAAVPATPPQECQTDEHVQRGAAASGSKEPLDRRWWILLTAGWALLTVLGSWVPFHFVPARAEDAWRLWWANGSWQTQAASDLAVNLLLGVPLGFGGVLCARRSRARRPVSRHGGRRWSLASLLGVVVVCGLVAVWATFVEVGQHWFRDRVPSRADTLAQALGGALGAITAWAGGDWFAERLTVAWGRRREQAPWEAWLDLYVLGYVAWMLIPFLPLLSFGALQDKWRRGGIRLSLGEIWLADQPAALYTALVATPTAFPIGAAFAFWFRAMQGPLRWATATLGAILAVVSLELAQTFVATRTVAVDDALWSAIGAAAGVGLIGHRAGLSVGTARTLSAAPALAMLACLYALGYLLLAAFPFAWIESPVVLQTRWTQLWTFGRAELLGGNDLLRVTNWLAAAVGSAPLGALAAGAATQACRHRRAAAGLAMFAVVSVCVAAELVQLLTRERTPSLLDLAVRLLGAVLGGVVAWQWLRWRDRLWAEASRARGG